MIPGLYVADDAVYIMNKASHSVKPSSPVGAECLEQGISLTVPDCAYILLFLYAMFPWTISYFNEHIQLEWFLCSYFPSNNVDWEC